VATVLPDIIAPDLKILFVGINPGLYSAKVGHHFGRPGNRFWKTLFAAGLTPRLFAPAEQEKLLELGLGITNIVDRPSAKASELSSEEVRAGAKVVERKVRRYRPRLVAFLGITAYRTAFDRPEAKTGAQADEIGESRIWVLPNPSGLNAHYQARELAAVFRELGAAAR
jgi:TDG/mug DNA glycosylase family protein